MWASDGHHRTYRNMGFISPVIVTGGCWHILTHSGVTHLTQRPAIAILTDSGVTHLTQRPAIAILTDSGVTHLTQRPAKPSGQTVESLTSHKDPL